MHLREDASCLFYASLLVAGMLGCLCAKAVKPSCLTGQCKSWNADAGVWAGAFASVNSKWRDQCLRSTLKSREGLGPYKP